MTAQNHNPVQCQFRIPGLFRSRIELSQDPYIRQHAGSHLFLPDALRILCLNEEMVKAQCTAIRADMQSHDAQTGLMQFDDEVSQFSSVPIHGKHRTGRFFPFCRFRGQHVEPGMIGLELHILCQHLQVIQAGRTGGGNGSNGFITGPGHVLRCRCRAGHFHRLCLRQIFFSPLCTLDQSLRMGTDSPDILKRRAGKGHQGLADRQHHFPDDTDILRPEQRIHVIHDGAANGVFLGNHRKIGLPGGDIGNGIVYRLPGLKNALILKPETGRLLRIRSLRSEKTDPVPFGHTKAGHQQHQDQHQPNDLVHSWFSSSFH